ncbi:hypothetical protein OIU74_009988 [Salix koriyanagi]|uniref:Uncharacterized protein n=1 Tax=Salix koriyanagi TaxID=2511006 RepID=A0A9Q0TCA7_9ROSI|nr:hypothetical protein OIU74_009988 [Salix koriyanagi]
MCSLFTCFLLDFNERQASKSNEYSISVKASSLPDDGDLTAGEYQFDHQYKNSKREELFICFARTSYDQKMQSSCINTKLNVQNLRWLRRPSEVNNTDGKRKRSRDGVLGLEGKRASLVGSR